MDGIKHSLTHPKYLNSNSTSHKWVFGAIAELVDNSVDARATQFYVDAEDFTNATLRNPTVEKLICIRDNGAGMDPAHVHKMLSFGHCEKTAAPDGTVPIGHYGNGFKSGSMRVGRDAVVFTFDGTYRTMGMLSQTYLDAIKAEEVLVPIASWQLNGEPVPGDHKPNIEQIMKFSPFNTFEKIMKKFSELGPHGTLIAIYNLRRLEDGELELDFESNITDVRVSDATRERDEVAVDAKRRVQDEPPREEFSLRAYLAILYLKPRMQIYVRGHRVHGRRLKCCLWRRLDYTYTPRDKEQVGITFGFNTYNKQHMGMMIYHRNRLIKMYVRIGIQLSADSRGVGVIGVVDASFLTPTHNKQDFTQNAFYTNLMINLKDRLREYWKDCNIDVSEGGIGIGNLWGLLAKAPNKDTRWRQCDKLDCLKWRKLPKDNPQHQIFLNTWECSMHPDPKCNKCTIPESEISVKRPKVIPKKRARDNNNNNSRAVHVVDDDEVVIVHPPTRDLPARSSRNQNISYAQDNIGERLPKAQRITTTTLPSSYPTPLHPRTLPPNHKPVSLASSSTTSRSSHSSNVSQSPNVSVSQDTSSQGGNSRCTPLCAQMVRMCNLLGANITCAEIHNGQFNEELFVLQIRGSFLREISSLKEQLIEAKQKIGILEGGEMLQITAGESSQPHILQPKQEPIEIDMEERGDDNNHKSVDNSFDVESPDEISNSPPVSQFNSSSIPSTIDGLDKEVVSTQVRVKQEVEAIDDDDEGENGYSQDISQPVSLKSDLDLNIEL